MSADRELSEKREKALELHLAGATYEAIARAVGYAGKQGAHQAVQEAWKDRAADPSAAEAVQLEMGRLDAMLTALWPKARRGDVAAIDRVIKIGERQTELRALMLGEAKPTADSVESAQDVVERKLRAVQ